MNYKSSYSVKKMIVISILSGISGFLLSNFGFEARVGEINISIPWSLIFPMITAMAFGSRFGVIAGLAGGAYFPFLLWPNNGIANVTTALFFLVVYFMLGLLHDKSFWGRQKKDSIRIITILTVCMAIFALYYSLLFNPLLSFNPSLGFKNAIVGLPTDVFYSFFIKNSINLILLTFVALTLLELAWVRKALGMQFLPATKSNNAILVYAILVSASIWLLLVGLGYSLLRGDNAFKSQQLSLVLFVILVAAFVVAKVLFRYNENKFNTENELKEREERLKKIIATSPDGLAITDLNGTAQYFSPQCLKMWGFNNPEEAIGRNVMEFVHPDYHRKAINNIKEIINGNLTGPAEYLMVKKDGTTFFAEANANVLRDADNKPTGVLYFQRDITERKKAEENRQENVEQHRMLLQTAMDGFWLVDLEGRLKEVNKTYCQMSGYSEQELLSMRISDLELIEQNKDRAKHIQKVIEKGEDRFETQHRRKDGSIFDVEIGAQYRSAKEGQIVAFIKDITERKQAVAALYESEKRFKLLYENAPLSYQSLDQNGCLIDVNPTWLETLGYKPHEVIGRYFGDFMTPESAELIQKRFPAFIAAGEIHEYQFEMVRKDGSYFIVSYEGKIGYDEQGNFKQTHCIFTDITERKRAEDALKESEKNYRILVETMPDGVYKSTHAGKFVETNPAMVKMLGYNSKEELLAIDIRNDLYIENSDRDNITLDELNQELGIFQLRKKDGSIIWVEDHGWYSYNESFEITYHEGVMRDVTERIQKEQELNMAKERAEESDRLKSAFLANMSHEIRTPMNGILGFAGLLKEPGLSGENHREYIQIIEKSGARMLNIINDIISISKIEAGLMKVNWQDTNINEQIDYIYTFFKPEVEGKGMQFSFKNSLPFKEAILRTDREKVYAILTNLVKNAIKYTENGSIEFGYTLRQAQGTVGEPAEVEFYVKDTGIGIPEDRQEAIFERFIQAEIVDKMARQGAGLGLSISKAYAEMLGGKIWVESALGNLSDGKAGGSTFYFTLPYQSEKMEEKNAKNEVLTSVEATPVKKLNILIVEDDEPSEMLISHAVKKFGNVITSVKTGTKAVAACLNNPDIDLVLMDIMMPEMDGYEATRQIRKFNKDVIIIAQTAYALEGDKEKAIAAGCNGYIAKPINKAELLALIHRHFIK